MNKDAVTFVVFRNSMDENTVAIISASFLDADKSKSNFLGRLQAALSHWASTTEEGADAYEESSEDFNIGDLSLHVDDKQLQNILSEYGIKGLEISTHEDVSSEWSFDTHLIDITD